MAATKRVHYYHADACGFGGFLERPFEQNIVPQASLSLSPSGGYGSSRSEKFRLEGLFSYESAFTQVSGRLSQKENGGWLTLSTATVEGLNILDVITADRVSAQVSTEHPLEGNYPKVSFLGTTFENLKIGGYHVDVELGLDICDQGNGRGYPEQPCVNNKLFLTKVVGQYCRMREGKSVNSLPKWIAERYPLQDVENCEDVDNAEGEKRLRYEKNVENMVNADSDYVLASVVKQAGGEFPGQQFGNVFEVPDIGQVFLGELLVDDHTFRLTMLRVELGCRAEGSLSGPICLSNGVTKPPS
jgi:hypothetical protein